MCNTMKLMIRRFHWQTDTLVRFFIGLIFLCAIPVSWAQTVKELKITQLQASYNFIDIEWDTVPNADGYEVIVIGKKQRQYYVGNANIRLCEDILSGYVYSIYIKPISFHGQIYAKQANLCILTPPQCLEAKNRTENSFTACWKIHQKLNEYYLEVATDSTFTNILPEFQGWKTNKSKASIGNLIPNTSYYYRVKTIDRQWNKHYSNVISVKNEK